MAVKSDLMSLTPAELSFLAWENPYPRPGDCTICGAPLVRTRIGEGRKDIYRCSSPEADFSLYASAKNAEALMAEAWAHAKASEYSFNSYHHPLVGRLAEALLQALEAAGTDVSVPVGEVFFPRGHGSMCCKSHYRHAGNGQWERVDDNYAHDPSHADLDSLGPPLFRESGLRWPEPCEEGANYRSGPCDMCGWSLEGAHGDA